MSKIKIRMRTIIALAVPAVTVLGAGIAYLLVTGSATHAMNGTLTVTTNSGTSSFCSNTTSDVSDGTQVTVVAPNQSVIGTGDLHSVRSSAQTILGCVEGIEVFRFRVTGLPSEPRYGVQIATVPGTIWLSPAELPHASLSLS